MKHEDLNESALCEIRNLTYEALEATRDALRGALTTDESYLDSPDARAELERVQAALKALDAHLDGAYEFFAPPNDTVRILKESIWQEQT